MDTEGTRMIRRPEALRRLGVAPATLRRMVLDGRLPPPRRLSTRAIAWTADEFAAALENLPRVRR